MTLTLFQQGNTQARPPDAKYITTLILPSYVAVTMSYVLMLEKLRWDHRDTQL